MNPIPSMSTKLQRTNWTSLPDPAAGAEAETDVLAPDSLEANRIHLVQTALALLRRLEASLENSQKALLARDVSAIELETLEQKRLHEKLRELSAFLLARSPVDSREAAGTELHAVQIRVLHLGRVQIALLEWARRSHNALAHLLAGPGASYSAPAFPTAPWKTAGGNAAV